MSGTQQTQQEQENTSQPIKENGRRSHKKQPPKVTIKNLTDYQLNKGEIPLLSKGLKFAPVPKGKDLIEMRADFNQDGHLLEAYRPTLNHTSMM